MIKKLKKLVIWYLMFTKRLLLRRSFLLLLLLIPVFVPLTNLAMQEDSGVITVALGNDNSPFAEDIIADLTARNSVILFRTYDSEKDAIAAVESFDADAAWVFDGDFEEKLTAYAKGDSITPFLTVHQREETISLRLSREVLFSAVYPRFSYEVYQDYITEEMDKTGKLSAETLQKFYEDTDHGDSLITMTTVNGEPVDASVGYLSVPLRGILSIMVVLCGLASAMYFLSDLKRGIFDWLSPRKRWIPALASCLSAVVLAAIAMLIALSFSGLSTGLLQEAVSMLLFVFCATAFCLVLCLVFPSAGALGAAIPGILLILLALSPIFFYLDVLPPLRAVLPTPYYLEGVYNLSHVWAQLIYCVGMFGVSVGIINHIKPLE